MPEIRIVIPENMDVARAYSSGGNLLDVMPELKGKLQGIVADIKEGKV